MSSELDTPILLSMATCGAYGARRGRGLTAGSGSPGLTGSGGVRARILVMVTQHGGQWKLLVDLLFGEAAVSDVQERCEQAIDVEEATGCLERSWSVVHGADPSREPHGKN